ncbi:MAG TPA: LysR family transcriptional regulator ArgP [Microlunatus sp.]
MDWDLAQLRAYAATVDHGSLEAAAGALHVTPSAVSQRLKALERTVGAVLLQRSRPVRPTEPGEGVLRLARQVEALTRDTELSLGTGDLRPVVRLAVNADSLSTWVLPALAPLSAELSLELIREGEDHTADLLRDGSAMAAITTERTPVQGCTVERLGSMRYRPMAAPGFAARWFPDGLAPSALAVAPLVVFDVKDRMQHRVLERHGVSNDPPIHLVPASTQYVEAVRLGFGWGMVPDLQRADWTAEDGVVLSAADDEDVALFWQQWSLRTPSLEQVAAAVRAASADMLRPIG